MNHARSLAPDLVLGDFSHFWVYAVGPVAGSMLAVGLAHILRGPGGHDALAAGAAQGDPDPAEPNT
jgi:aquaporin Z